MTKKKVIALLCVTALVVFLAWPITTLNCPEWEVRVVDENGQPLPGVLVRLDFRNYSAERENHEVDKRTDANGYVKFPSETLKATGLKRAIVSLESAEAGVHAAYGPSAYVLVFADGMAEDPKKAGRVPMWFGKTPTMRSQFVLSRKSPLNSHDSGAGAPR
jgi:hypothetical protein